MSESGKSSKPATASGSKAAPRKSTPQRVAELRQDEDKNTVKKALDEMWEHRDEDMQKWARTETRMEDNALTHAHDEDSPKLIAENVRLQAENDQSEKRIADLEKKIEKRKCCMM
ncbi:hypothetical protein LTR12_001968 [Friedmanniomyces endolithicus]|nr:hypothetical protein LTR74_010808 [Friedmanniomyces endolithicus]KAK1823557.1 hypothetical protein LTR12_001968 [Friedmanniomyces endolithicus]